MTRERPILFSAPMVRAIREGRKTMTRRVVKNVPAWATRIEAHTEEYVAYMDSMGQGIGNCPYGQPGDRLWVKEKWRVGAWDQDYGRIAVDYAASPDLGETPWRNVENEDLFERLWVQSSDDAMAAGLSMDEEGAYHWEPGRGPCRWRPSIFMPRWASRITLEITNVRVERLQDISEADALREGVEWNENYYYSNPYMEFETLWNTTILGRDACLYGWKANPWVWVVEFKQIEEGRETA